MPTVADNIVATLKASGVRRIYGIPGDSLNGFTDAIRRDGSIAWLHVRHEEAAAFAAGAEAAITGDLAVVAASCGPGNLHLINGLYDAHRSRVPVLAIAAHISREEIGSEYHQETHPQELFRECSVYCELVSVPEQLPRVLGLRFGPLPIRRVKLHTLVTHLRDRFHRAVQILLQAFAHRIQFKSDGNRRRARSVQRERQRSRERKKRAASKSSGICHSGMLRRIELDFI